MELPELANHTFIVRIWLEEPAAHGRVGLWRGSITHMPSGRHSYLAQLDDVNRFMRPYLDNLTTPPVDEEA